MPKSAYGHNRHLCVVLHGIEYDPAVVSWVDDFVIDSYQRTDVELFPEMYGKVSGWKVWASNRYRNKIVNREVDALFRMQSRLKEWDPDAKFSIFAHSLGATIVEAAFKRGFVFHNVILMMGAMDEYFDWHKYNDQFNAVFVYWSRQDEMIGKAHWGKQGLFGPKVAHPRVMSYKTDWKHDQFMDRYYLHRPFHTQLLEQIEFMGDV